MDMDGTNHRVIAQLPEQKDLSGKFNGGGSYFFDNGYLILPGYAPAHRTIPDYALAGLQDPAGDRGNHPAVSGGYPASHGLASQTVCLSATGTSTFPCPRRRDWQVSPMRKATWKPGVSSVFLRIGTRSNSPMVNFDNVLYYHRAGVGLCEYDKATGTETVKVPMDVYYANVSVHQGLYFPADAGFCRFHISASCWHTTGTTIFWESWNWRRSVCGSPSWNTPPPTPFTSPPTAGPSPTTSTPTTWTAWS